MKLVINTCYGGFGPRIRNGAGFFVFYLGNWQERGREATTMSHAFPQ